MKSKINVKQEQRIGKFVRDFSIVVQDERSVNYNILRNMLRELLNSQDQEEENTVCEGCGKTITSRFMQSYTKGDGMHSYCLSCDPEKQDTPEQKEEWEEKFMDVLETFKDEICSNFFASSKPLTDFIQQLLEERETFTKGDLNNLLDWIENGYVPSIEARDEIYKGIIEKVVKLLNKK